MTDNNQHILISKETINGIMDVLQAHDERIQALERLSPDEMAEGRAAGTSINQRITLEVHALVKKLYSEGMAVAAIARNINRPRSTVQYLLNMTEDRVREIVSGKRRRKG